MHISVPRTEEQVTVEAEYQLVRTPLCPEKVAETDLTVEVPEARTALGDYDFETVFGITYDTCSLAMSRSLRWQRHNRYHFLRWAICLQHENLCAKYASAHDS